MNLIVKIAEDCGEFVTGDDGFVCYWPKAKGGYNAHDLRALADELDRRNAGWEEDIRKYFGDGEGND